MTDHTISSGNVFADLGFSADEAEILALKSGLVHQIGKAIEGLGLKQVDAAALIGTDQPTLSKVLGGRLGGVSVERLTQWLNKLGYDVRVSVAARPDPDGRGHLSLIVGAG